MVLVKRVTPSPVVLSPPEKDGINITGRKTDIIQLTTKDGGQSRKRVNGKDIVTVVDMLSFYR